MPPAAERNVYVYRLNVTLPPGSDVPGWEPDNWTEWCDQNGWTDYESDTGAATTAVFSWTKLMRRKHFLSGAGAEQRAKLLREFGAIVKVERSNAVRWQNVTVVGQVPVTERILVPVPDPRTRT